MGKDQFIGEVEVQWLGDGRSMRLLSDFAFVDSHGEQWTAPAGSVVDGASIPKIFWSSLGSPFVGKYRRASILHDVACQERTRPYKKVHKMFYEAMRADGTPNNMAKKLYRAVKLFGPRWDKQGRTIKLEIDSDELYL